MPIYEYLCQSCGGETEKLQKISDQPLSVCPSCGEASLKRKISAARFRLKGAGWYETDFKKDGKKNLAGDGGGESSAPAKTDAGSPAPAAPAATAAKPAPAAPASTT